MKKPNHCNIYFVRHGQTDWNAERRLQGHSDIPLNSKGIHQALELKRLLASISFSHAFSSDLVRAKKTAEIVLEPRSIPLQEKMELRERKLGPFEGRSYADLDSYLNQNYPLLHTYPKEPFLSCKWHPEVETLQAVYQRVEKFLYQVFSSSQGSSILIVSHAGVMRSILDHWNFLPNHRWIVSNCAFIQLKVQADSISPVHTVGITRKTISQKIKSIVI